MVTALQSKAQLAVLAEDAADTVDFMVRRTSGQWESRRLQLLDTAPGVTAYYSEGSAALAADFYDDARSAARATGSFAAQPVILDRAVKIRRGIAWASEPLSINDEAAAIARLTEILTTELRRPYRDTVLTNRLRDPAAVGWRRLASPGACKFCRMLADRGTVYRQSTATFAAHENCGCTAAPVFGKEDVGPEADALQYAVSKRRPTAAAKRRLKEFLDGIPD